MRLHLLLGRGSHGRWPLVLPILRPVRGSDDRVNIGLTTVGFPAVVVLHFLPIHFMGQYFAAINIDKKEYVCPWCIGGGAKLWEWAANPAGAVFTLLLRKSDEGGGGDYYGYHKGCGEGGPITCDVSPVVGRWAGDHVALVGDYDGSRLWDEIYKARTFRNISKQLVETWNDFIEIERMNLTYEPCSSCRRAVD